jgi:hypothetical protein
MALAIKYVVLMPERFVGANPVNGVFVKDCSVVWTPDDLGLEYPITMMRPSKVSIVFVGEERSVSIFVVG